MSTIKTWSWAAPLTTMLPKKANIDPAVRAKLDELGVDTVRSKLVWIRNVRDLAEQDDLQPLGVGLSASRRQMQDWLTEKAARETLWVRVGAIAAVLAALFSLRLPRRWQGRRSAAKLLSTPDLATADHRCAQMFRGAYTGWLEIL